MKNKWIGIFVALIAIAVVAILVMDTLNSRTGQRGDNPFKLEVDQYYQVDPEMILYKETRQIRLGDVKAKGLAYGNKQLHLLTDTLWRILELNGQEVLQVQLDDEPDCIHVNGETIYIGFGEYLAQYYVDGRLIKKWDSPGEKTVITSIATRDDLVFVADAGNRRVLIYDTHGLLEGQFEGKREADDIHGFVIPSGYFDLAVQQDELWVVNPGMHALENYTDDGILRGYWEKTSMKIDGFSGCCNPAQMTIDAQGNFITSEKGLVRMKIYKPSGELIGIVAEPAKFKDGENAPEPVVTESGQIIALDFDQRMIRYFEKK